MIDLEGNAVVGCEVYVRKQSDNSLVTLYSDDGSTTTSNPVTTDSRGLYSFWTANDTLKLQFFVDAVQEAEITNLQHFDIDGITTFGFSLIDDADAAAARTTLGITDAATQAVATAAQFRANTADKLLDTDGVWSSAAYVALTPGTNVATDMSAGFNFTLAMGGNYTLDNPTNTKDGQTGAIVITQDGTGSRTLAYGSNWKFAGGTDPVLSTAAGAVDVLFYQVISSTVIFGNLVKAIA